VRLVAALLAVEINRRVARILEGLPIELYIAANVTSSSRSAASASFLICRSGCSRGTRSSGDSRHSIEA
jgi:hypothetical protein